MQRITLPLPTRLNEAYHPLPGGRGIYKSAKAKEWEAEAAWTAVAQGATCHSAGEELEVWIVQYQVRHADIDSRLKVLLDGMQGILWENDRQIRRIHVENRIDRKSPRLELTVALFQEKTP